MFALFSYVAPLATRVEMPDIGYHAAPELISK
jgi:hypothetical protein